VGDEFVKVRGATEAQQHLDQLGERGGDIRPIAHQVEAVVHRSNERRFDTRGLGSWPADSPDTEAEKSGGSVLVDSGALKRSLTSSGGGAVSKEHPTALSFGTSVPYARFHQYGTRNMPKRKLIDLTASDRKKITDLISRYVAKGGSGLESLL
jgi:phage gpG-like protein